MLQALVASIPEACALVEPEQRRLVLDLTLDHLVRCPDAVDEAAILALLQEHHHLPAVMGLLVQIRPVLERPIRHLLVSTQPDWAWAVALDLAKWQVALDLNNHAAGLDLEELLLLDLHLELHVCVFDPDHSPRRPAAAGSARVVSTQRTPAGFPLDVGYSIVDQPQVGSLVLCTQRHPIYLERTTAKDGSLHLTTTTSRLDRTLLSLDWLERSFENNDARLETLLREPMSVPWSTPENYTRSVQHGATEVRTRLHRMITKLVADPVRAAHIELHIPLHLVVDDQRDFATESLPEVDVGGG